MTCHEQFDLLSYTQVSRIIIKYQHIKLCWRNIGNKNLQWVMTNWSNLYSRVTKRSYVISASIINLGQYSMQYSERNISRRDTGKPRTTQRSPDRGMKNIKQTELHSNPRTEQSEFKSNKQNLQVTPKRENYDKRWKITTTPRSGQLRI